MSKPPLCIDIDNVIAQTDLVIRQVIREYTGGRVNLSYRHILDFDYPKCCDARGQHISVEEWHTVHKLFSRPPWIMSVKPYPSIQNILRRLSEHYELHIATSRLADARKATVEWLDEHSFPPHRLHFLMRGEKHLLLGGLQTAIEDDPVQAVEFEASGQRCYVLAHPWNRHVPSGLFIQRIRNWAAIERALLPADRHHTKTKIERGAN